MGRIDDVINVAGHRLSTGALEAVLAAHPAVAECAVIGMPDDTWGEAVSAAIVTKPDATLTLPALREWCKSRLSVYKVPQRLAVVPALPRNAMGKVTKPAVRSLFG